MLGRWCWGTLCGGAVRSLSSSSLPNVAAVASRPDWGIRGDSLKQVRARDGAPALQVAWADGDLILRWTGREQNSVFSPQWLRSNCYVEFHSDRGRAARAPQLWRQPDALPEFAFGEVSTDQARLLACMETVADVGFALIRGVPREEGMVDRVASLMDEPMHTIYEHPFNVVSVERPINLAYTSQGLDLHQDLAYYESPPGMQLLHALHFDDTIQGGESTFLDGMALAEHFRRVDPAGFEVLCRVPLTLHKDHMERENPVRMEYMRPIIEVNQHGEVIRFSWAPVFEGVLRAREEDVHAFYGARKRFCALLQDIVVAAAGPADDRPPLVRVRLQPGDLVLFNNRRMLHGREAFGGTSPGSKRHLQGTYLHIDHFLSKMRVLRRQVGAHPQQEQWWPRVGNGSWH